MEETISIEQATVMTIVQNGPLTHRKLFDKVFELRHCSSATFSNSLKDLTERKILERKKVKGTKQEIEYSINKTSGFFFKDVLNELDKILDGIDYMPKLHHMFKKYNKYSKRYGETKELREQRDKMLKIYPKHVAFLLEQSQVELFLMITGDRVFAKKAEYIHKRKLEMIQKSLNEIKKIDQDIYLDVLALIASQIPFKIPGISA